MQRPKLLSTNYYLPISLSLYIINKSHHRRRIKESWEGVEWRGKAGGAGRREEGPKGAPPPSIRRYKAITYPIISYLSEIFQDFYVRALKCVRVCVCKTLANFNFCMSGIIRSIKLKCGVHLKQTRPFLWYHFFLNWFMNWYFMTIRIFWKMSNRKF